MTKNSFVAEVTFKEKPQSFKVIHWAILTKPKTI